MDLTNCPTKNELAVYLKEQHGLYQEGVFPKDKKLLGPMADAEAWKAYALELEPYRLTEEKRKSNEAWKKLLEAIAYANENFSEWHLGRLRSAAEISKDEWFFLSNPDLLNLDVLEAALKK